jgi:hypothetical protein
LDAAAKEPLAPEPFLIRGAAAQLAGDGVTAQRAFEAAQWRDPRSLPAADFLADRYLRTGDVNHGLEQVAALARLAPSAPQVVAPYLAAYAKKPATWPRLRAMFRADPRLEDIALVILGSNISTVPAALALADPRKKTTSGPWFVAVLNTLIGEGDYQRAHEEWTKATGHSGHAVLLYDTSFSDRNSPPPFNWDLIHSNLGRAERQQSGGLHVIFYGREDGFLASQLMLLPRSSYALSMQLVGTPASARMLSWSIWCDKSAEPLVSVSLDAAAAHGLHFTAPAGCPAQWLRLGGASSGLSKVSEVTITSLKLEKGRPSG